MQRKVEFILANRKSLDVCS